MRDACIQTRFFVTILQGWAYKTQQTRVMLASNQTLFFVTIFMLSKRRFWTSEQTIWSSLFEELQYSRPWKVFRKDTTDMLLSLPKSLFGEHNMARMGLQNTTNTRDALMIVWSDDAMRCIAFLGCHDLLPGNTWLRNVRSQQSIAMWAPGYFKIVIAHSVVACSPDLL